MSIALHLPCRLLTPELSPTQVVLAHLPHRCSPSSGDHLPLLFVTGYSRMSFGIFQGKIKSIFDFNKIVALIGTNFYNAVGWVSTGKSVLSGWILRQCFKFIQKLSHIGNQLPSLYRLVCPTSDEKVDGHIQGIGQFQ